MKTINTSCIPKDLLAKTFIDAYREEIRMFALTHRDSDKEGFIHIEVDKDYRLISKKFIEGIDWNKGFIVGAGDCTPWPGSDMDRYYFLYEIHFQAIDTWYRNGECYYECSKRTLMLLRKN